MGLEVFYEHPFECPHINGSWCDRIIVRPAPAGIIVPGPCWIWTGWNNGKPITRHGEGPYGKVRIDGRGEYIHRVMWERTRDMRLEVGDEIDHLCRVRLCFSPHHIECTNREENLRRRDEYAARYSETVYDPQLEAEILEGFGL